MSEVLGKRSLLGIAVVLIWLVLFHLLVNLWLLCVFTSLLVVLGGWLGSQAVLESKNIVHLERFITLKQVLSSVEDEQNLDKEIHSTVRKIIRDFVNSWYSSVSSESGFEIEVQEAMIVMAMELKMRARQIDRKYETALGCDKSIQSGSEDADILQSSWENPSSIQPVAYHTVNRRYSEFLNLQTRLEEKVELRKLVKGVKGPKKIFPDMPFGNMDSDKIEARKGLLETFLKQLCAIPEIVNSEEMQEFLALNTDARIAFVKKPFIVSRIDKIVVNAIVDTLKTAFPRSEPQSPTEENESEVDGGKISADKKNKSRLKLSSKNNTFMNGSDVKPQVLFSCEQSSTMFNRMSLEELQGFITEQEKLVIKAETMREDSPVVSELSGCMDDTLSEKFISEHGKRRQGAASEMGLAEVALNILCLLMREQWSWLCTENIQRTTRLLFGTLIDRWLDVNVANLTCTRYWVVYLQVIQEAVWPGGVLRMKPQLERSQQQKDATRQHALHCLMRFLPDLVLDMLGSDNYKRSWQTVLESLQNPYINRHLIYCIFDLLLEFIVPEIPEVNFQRNLLQTLSKNPENTLA
ncbi:sorting nexin-19 isoform X6 [Betta splendens]|uniref:Sorting nexin-19 isoform X6 n=1 Tax=Betta splendens TaxID=158456 RepID=A0A6P7P1Q7_BETSP|nr:sorting nexin-19 isoform X6 [Betta splendens]